MINTTELHPEDAIYKAKTFINELQKIQEDYFLKLSKDLNITKEGEEFLFDYIYNTDESYDGFDCYLEDFGKKYSSMVKKDTFSYMSNDSYKFDFSSYEPPIESNLYNYSSDFNTPVNSHDIITIKHSDSGIK